MRGEVLAQRLVSGALVGHEVRSFHGHVLGHELPDGVTGHPSDHERTSPVSALMSDRTGVLSVCWLGRPDPS